ncbi:hypothetical protein POVCU2_0023670 [Plasmodium ovale curtisi]|uniref:Uncharacterized protein n=1 Tax=Plasmodium ovale curtisi TaxID=864141 RepID=A0A1A8VW75_PLAOA|nr:hypothetical protein POVCU2_0023670 [Plasmodium ovale curtisi]
MRNDQYEGKQINLHATVAGDGCNCNEVLRNDVLHNEVLRNDVLHNEVLRNEVLRNDVSCNDVFREIIAIF